MTIKEMLNRAADQSPDRVALKYKRGGAWQIITFSKLRERVWHVSEILFRLGIQAGDRVALFRENSPEWYELYYGIVGLGAIAVPVDAKLQAKEVEHVLRDCAVSAVFCSFRNVEMVSDVDNLVVLDVPEGEGTGYLVYDRLFAEVAEKASSAARAFDQFDPVEDAPASFIYTSGTTGRSKGAVLTHRNFMSNVEGIAEGIDIRPTDNFMLILPLHHSFAFTTMLLLPVYAQCQVSLVENLKTIKANMEECSPTVLLAVPLLLEKMLTRIQAGIKKQAVARWMCRCGLTAVVGKKVHAGLGGSMRLIVSGGAPISPATLRGWGKLGFRIVEGYGITETAPVLTLNPPHASRPGTVGLPISGVEVRIDNPNAEGVGEIVARGNNVMPGYYNNPAETKLVLRKGWYHTGDLGYFDEKGYLVISGRKKSLIVNREGKNIYPEEVERQVLKSSRVLECLVLGYREEADGVGERVGMIIVPDPDAFSDEPVPQIEEQVRAEVRELLSELSSYKQPRKILIRFNEFEKTTTQKIKRYLYKME